MTAPEILDWLASNGITITLQGDGLAANQDGRHKPSEFAAIVERIKARKPELLAHLKSTVDVIVDWPLRQVTAEQYIEIAAMFGVPAKEAAEQAADCKRLVSEILVGGEWFLVRG